MHRLYVYLSYLSAKWHATACKVNACTDFEYFVLSKFCRKSPELESKANNITEKCWHLSASSKDNQMLGYYYVNKSKPSEGLCGECIAFDHSCWMIFVHRSLKVRLIQQADCASFFFLSALCCCPKSCNDRFSSVFSCARGPVIRAPSRAIDPYWSLEPSARPLSGRRESAWHQEADGGKEQKWCSIQKQETIGQRSS